MKPLNIVIICDAITNFVAGCFVSALRFSDMLSERGHNVTIISSRYPNDPETEQRGRITIHRLRSFPVPKSNKRLYFAYPNKRAVRRILTEAHADIVHFMVPTPLSHSAITVAQSLNIPLIGHSHTQPENWSTYIPRVLRRAEPRIISLSYRYLIRQYRKANAIICPTEFSKELLQHYGLPNAAHVISNGVDTARFKRTHTLEHPPTLLFVGRLDPEKNLHTLLDAVPLLITKHPDLRVVIVGDGTKAGELKEHARRRNLTGVVHFTGRVSDEALLDAYNNADLFVLPSLIELEGMVVLEAMAHDLPLLIADSPLSAARFLVNNNGLLFTPQDSLDLADKASTLLDNAPLRKKLSQKSHELSQALDIRNSIAKLEHVYADVTH